MSYDDVPVWEDRSMKCRRGVAIFDGTDDDIDKLLKKSRKVDIKRLKKSSIKNRKSITMWLWILFGIVLVIGLYQVIFTMMFYEPPTAWAGITDYKQWYAVCLGLFVVLTGMGIMLHGIAIVRVR